MSFRYVCDDCRKVLTPEENPTVYQMTCRDAESGRKLYTNHYHWTCLVRMTISESAEIGASLLRVRARVAMRYHPGQIARAGNGGEFYEMADTTFDAVAGYEQRIILPAVPGFDNTLNEPFLLLSVWDPSAETQLLPKAEG